MLAVMPANAVGLCLNCAHARVVESARGSTFYLCELARSDATFVRYPRLPVLRCAGHLPTANKR